MLQNADNNFPVETRGGSTLEQKNDKYLHCMTNIKEENMSITNSKISWVEQAQSYLNTSNDEQNFKRFKDILA